MSDYDGQKVPSTQVTHVSSSQLNSSVLEDLNTMPSEMSIYLETMPSFTGQKLEFMQFGSTKACFARFSFVTFIESNFNRDFIVCATTNKDIWFLKMETTSKDSSIFALQVSPTSFICGATWNERYQKLFSWDSKGMFAIWAESDREKEWRQFKHYDMLDPILSIKFSKDDSKYAIVTKSGKLGMANDIMGCPSWTTRLQKMEPTCLSWSTNDEIVVGCNNGKIIMFNIEGQQLLGIGLHSFELLSDQTQRPTLSEVVAIQLWSPILKAQNPLTPIEFVKNPELAARSRMLIVFKNGVIRISKDLRDPVPTILQCNLTPKLAEWSPNGSCILIIGKNMRANNCFLFLSASGQELGRHEQLSTYEIDSVCWDISGTFVYIEYINCVTVVRVTPTFEMETRSGAAEELETLEETAPLVPVENAESGMMSSLITSLREL